MTKIHGSSQSYFFLSCSPSHRLTNQRQGRRWSSWCGFPLSSLPRVILAGAFAVVRNCKSAVLVFVTHAQGLTLPGGNRRLRMRETQCTVDVMAPRLLWVWAVPRDRPTACRTVEPEGPSRGTVKNGQFVPPTVLGLDECCVLRRQRAATLLPTNPKLGYQTD